MLACGQSVMEMENRLSDSVVFTVEVFVVLLRFGASMMDNTVPMIWRRIE